MKALRQIVLDTETTGLDASQDRIIEIGCVELVNRRLTGNNYHQYINPLQEISQGAIDVHGITTEFLSDKPVFSDVVYPFLDYVRGAELIIHNASFDIGFLNAEMQHFDPTTGVMSDYCKVIDSLAMARELHPGQRNDLDTLARRYTVDNSHRQLHGALLDSEILADVYLLMSGGQSDLILGGESGDSEQSENTMQKQDFSKYDLPVILASAEEIASHQMMLDSISEDNGGKVIWKQFEEAATH